MISLISETAYTQVFTHVVGLNMNFHAKRANSIMSCVVVAGSVFCVRTT